MGFHKLILLDTRPHGGERINEQDVACLCHTTAYKVLFHHLALRNTKLIVNLFAALVNEHLNCPAKRKKQVHTQTLVKALKLVLLLDLFYRIENVGTLLDVFPGVEEHSGLDNPHGLGQQSNNNSRLYSCQ